MENCVFCKIIKKEIPADIIHENDKLLAFLDINPLNKGHALVVPKQHCLDVFDIDSETLKAIAATAQEISRRMKDVLGVNGVNLFNASGQAAEQSVPHFHLHIIPRWLGDGIDFNAWWQLKIKKSSTEELKKLSDKLRF